MDENTLIGITKCVDTAKKLYASIFEKSLEEHNKLYYQFCFGIYSITYKFLMFKIWWKCMIFQKSFGLI
jgi:hypothetical protein